MERDDQAHEDLVDERVRRPSDPDRHEGAGEVERARLAACQHVHDASRQRGEREDTRVVRESDERPASQTVDDEDAGRRNQRRRPGTEHQHGGDVHTGGEAELLGVGRLACALVALDLEELRQDRRQNEQRERSPQSVPGRHDRGDGRDDAE